MTVLSQEISIFVNQLQTYDCIWTFSYTASNESWEGAWEGEH